MSKYIEGNTYNIYGIDYIYVNIGKITLGHYIRGLCCKYCSYVYKNIKDEKERYKKIEKRRYKISKLSNLLENLFYNKEIKGKNDLKVKEFFHLYNEFIIYDEEDFSYIREDIKSIYFFFILM